MSYKAALDADARIAAKNALKIMAALRQTFDAKAVYEQYLSTQPNKTKNPAQDRARARAWAIMNVTPNMQAMNTVMQRVLAEGYATGELFADEQLRIARELKKADDAYIDWANWKPGDRAAALLLRPPDAFQRLLQSQGIALKEMSQTTVRDIGNAVADAIDLGLSAERSAKNIMRQVANPARALSIAITEQNRAISFATINRYKESGLQQMEWEVSDPCDKCAQNANQIVNIGSAFNSGDTQPPAHPHCRCVLLPVIPDFGDAPLPGATLVEPPTPAPVSTPNLFPTPKEQIDQVLVALQAGKTLNEALDVYKALDSRPFEPGKWKILPRPVVKEAAIENISRALVFPMPRDQIERTFFGPRMKKVDRDFIEKAAIYKNGTVEVQFSSTGLKLTEAQRQMVLREVEKLQLANPKTRVAVHIDKNASGKYGWAYGGKQDLWVTPRTITEPKRAEGTFKMPVTPGVTQFEYTLAHEWGHLIDDITSGVQSPVRTNIIERLKKEFPDAFKSGYSGENTKEFFAEMFTEYYRTGGKTPNLLVQAMAKEFGWKVPEVPGSQIGYVAARNNVDYYLANVEVTEERLKKLIPTAKRPDGTVYTDWSAASGGSGPENIQLKNLMREQGFLGKPRVVGPDEFQKIVNQGATPIYRGLGAPTQEQVTDYVERLLVSDDPYIGRGFFGDGTYFASDRGIAERFSKQDVTGEIDFKYGEVLEGVLDPQAKVIDIEDLWKLRNEYVESMPYHGELAQAFEDDIGLFATTRGYDAIVNKNPMIGYTPDGQRRYAPGFYYTILNRSALIMKGTP
jgi:hypothetical protein